MEQDVRSPEGVFPWARIADVAADGLDPARAPERAFVGEGAEAPAILDQGFGEAASDESRGSRDEGPHRRCLLSDEIPARRPKRAVHLFFIDRIGIFPFRQLFGGPGPPPRFRAGQGER